MNRRQIISLVILVAGIAMIVFALHAMGEISSAKGSINSATGHIKNAYGAMANTILEGEASKYDIEVRWIFIGGIVLAVVGGGMLFFGRKKKKR